MLAVPIASMVLIGGVIVGFGLYFKMFGRRKLLLPSFLQAIRWVMVGIVIGVAADAYINANFFSERIFWVIFSIAMLMWVEHELLRIDEMTKS